jgi:hypothetical protein
MGGGWEVGVADISLCFPIVVVPCVWDGCLFLAHSEDVELSIQDAPVI